MEGNGTRVLIDRIILTGGQHVAAALDFLYRIAVELDAGGQIIVSQAGKHHLFRDLLGVRVEHDTVGIHNSCISRVIRDLGVNIKLLVRLYAKGAVVIYFRPLHAGKFSRVVNRSFRRIIGHVLYAAFVFAVCAGNCHTLGLLKEMPKSHRVPEGVPLVCADADRRSGRVRICDIPLHLYCTGIVAPSLDGNGVIPVSGLSRVAGKDIVRILHQSLPSVRNVNSRRDTSFGECIFIAVALQGAAA